VAVAGGCGEALEVAAKGGGDCDWAPRGAVEHRRKKKERERKEENISSRVGWGQQHQREVAAG